MTVWTASFASLTVMAAALLALYAAAPDVEDRRRQRMRDDLGTITIAALLVGCAGTAISIIWGFVR